MKNSMTIFPTPNERGKFTLTDSVGNEVQEGYEYPTREAALDAATLLWPVNSEWNGRKVRGGWRIDIDGEPPRKRSGTAPDTSLFLGQDRRDWLIRNGGIQPNIHRLVDAAMRKE